MNQYNLDFQFCIKEQKLIERWKDSDFQELTLLKTFDHPNIVNYIDVYQIGGNLYIVMEYIEGGNLRN
jgi:p21-activated kinase 1